LNDDGTLPAITRGEVFRAGEDPYVTYKPITDQLADIIDENDQYTPEPAPQYRPEPAP
jgi:hypothetical protein